MDTYDANDVEEAMLEEIDFGTNWARPGAAGGDSEDDEDGDQRPRPVRAVLVGAFLSFLSPPVSGAMGDHMFRASAA